MPARGHRCLTVDHQPVRGEGDAYGSQVGDLVDEPLRVDQAPGADRRQDSGVGDAFGQVVQDHLLRDAVDQDVDRVARVAATLEAHDQRAPQVLNHVGDDLALALVTELGAEDGDDDADVGPEASGACCEQLLHCATLLRVGESHDAASFFGNPQ